jgi:hypothetical protein
MSKKISYKDQRLTEAQQKKSKAIKSAGIKNYLGEQENVTVPKKWLSSPDHVVAELAYITPREQKILLDADLYGSLKGEPNRGPGGIMSLQGAGDGGGVESDGKGGHTGTGGGSGGKGPGPQGNFRETSNITNTTGGPRATGPSYSVAKDAKGNPFTGSGGPDLIDGKPEAEVVRDLIKAKSIYGYKPNKFSKLIPYKKPLDWLSEKLLTQQSKKNRMTYINSLPPEQKKAMIESLGLAMDDDYDENDMFDTNYDPNFSQDIVGTYGKGVSPLTGAPNQYQGLGSADALALINYDGEYMKQYGPQTLIQNVGGGDKSANILPYQLPGEEEIPEDTGPEYRFGTGQGIGRDVTLGYLATGGRARKAEGGIMELRARRAFGGIMDRVTGRKAYGLGSIFKSVKNAVGKVLKSDIGKAAIIGAGIYYGGGGNLFGMQRANAAGFGKAVAGKSFFGQGLAGALRSGAGSMFTKLPENATFMDKAMKFGKFGLLGLGLGLSPLGKAKPNEDSYADRGGRLKDSQGNEVLPSGIRTEINDAYESGDPERIAAIQKYYAFLPPTSEYLPYENFGEAGYRTTVATGGRIGKAEGGLMDLDGMEKDYRAEGGFVPIGAKEKADDVPARLSVNEFVFTADAVRGAGGGDIDKGAEIMENMMVNLEKGGTVSEESQGNAGAQQMFNTSERLGEVI